MNSKRVGAVVGGVALAALAIPYASAADGPVGSPAPVASAGAAAKSAERVDNLRLQRIATGSMRGRLVVAGSLDHLPDEGVAHDVVVRMKMTVPRKDGTRRIVGRKAMDYRLPAGVSPQDMTLRWLLSERESRVVDRAGDAARVSVVVRESRAAGPMATYVKVAERLRVEPLKAPPSYGSEPRSNTSTAFIPAGFYSDDNETFLLYTAEDPSGAPYVGLFGYGGSAANNYNDAWGLSPSWIVDGAESGTPGPGGGYIYMNGSVPSWSISTLWMPDCTETASGSGTFSGSTSAAMSWPGFGCAPDLLLYAWGGSASLEAASD